MKVLENIKWMPMPDGIGDIKVYRSTIKIEIEGEIYEVKKEITSEAYDGMFPALRDYHHKVLQLEIMRHIENRLFGSTAL